MDKTAASDNEKTSDASTSSQRKRSSKDRKKSKKDKKAKRAPAKKRPTLADEADKYDLYQQSVQCPEAEVKLLRKLYKKTRGKKARVLREDFGGTYAVSCEWVKGDKDREAWAIDLDPEPIAWGTANNLTELKDHQKQRVHVVEGNVLDTATPKADIVAAMNFSYFIFKTRDELRDYFKATLDNLADDGILACDMFGGHEVYEDDREEETPHNGFTYIWDQHKFNPVTHDYLFHIHFAFPDGSQLKKAFSYPWRMWSIPEVRELMLEAGYSRTDVYWEQSDEDGDGNGKYKKQEDGDADPAWLAYIVGVK